MNFALIGAAGYIAPRHMKAIRDTGHDLVAALDKHDGVGVMDSFYPNAEFFLESERFDRYMDKQRRQGDNKIDYVSICSPNYLHDAHIRLVLRNEAHAICEKPLVLNPWNIDGLEEISKETGKSINTILQLRLHPSIIQFKEKIDNGPKDKIYNLDLVYITSRGKWYFMSWKADESKSGGIVTNIGVHFFDMLTWIFGKQKQSTVHVMKRDKAAGLLVLERAVVRWFLSIDMHDIPAKVAQSGKKTFRSILCEGEEIEFSDGFTDLHTVSYQRILEGNGFMPSEARESIVIVHDLREKQPIGLSGDYHPHLKQINI